VISLPASIAAGDLLIVEIFLNGSIATSPGFTQLLASNIYWREADGTEGATVTFTGDNSHSSHNSYRITGWDDGGAPEGATDTGDTNAPSLTPSWGSKDTLWLAFVAIAANTACDFTAAPTDFTDLIKSAEAEEGGIRIRSASARRELTAASLDAGAFTTSGTIVAAVGTIVAIEPGASGDAVGASVGEAAVTGISAADKVADGSSSGVAVATGVGNALVDGVGSAVGIAVVSGVSLNVIEGVGSAAGTSTVTAVGDIPSSGVGDAAGTSTVTGVGNAIKEGVGNAAGTSTVSGIATAAEGVGSSEGTSDVFGVGEAFGGGNWVEEPALSGSWVEEAAL